MDIAAVALSTTKSLMPYFRATRSVDEPLAEDTPDNIKELWGSIVAKFRSEPPAEAALGVLIAQPGSPDNQAIFCNKLQEILAGDAVLLSQLAVGAAAGRATTDEQAVTAGRNEVAFDEGGAYPRPLPCRRRCEG